jgi:hypothetical protein
MTPCCRRDDFGAAVVVGREEDAAATAARSTMIVNMAGSGGALEQRPFTLVVSVSSTKRYADDS